MVPAVPERVVYTGRAHFAHQILVGPRLVGLRRRTGVYFATCFLGDAKAMEREEESLKV